MGGKTDIKLSRTFMTSPGKIEEEANVWFDLISCKAVILHVTDIFDALFTLICTVVN